MRWLTSISFLVLANCCWVSADWLIINGTESGRYEFPQMVAIILDNKYFCGGTLLNGNTVLTAAHCVCLSSERLKGEKAIVYIRQHDLHETHEDVLSFEITRIKCHHSFYTITDKTVKGIDLAVLKLDGFISNTLYKNINYTVLDTNSISTPGQRCEAVGWGSMSRDGKNKPRYLQKAYLNIMSNDECYRIYRSDIQNYNICAGSGPLSTSVCSGDSGGPLFCTDSSNRQIQVGIAQGISSCGTPNIPGVFTRISEVVNWISDNSKWSN